MSETIASLSRKIKGADDLGAVVRTIKAMAGSNITHFEAAVEALQDYYRTIELGLQAYFIQEKTEIIKEIPRKKSSLTGALIFGSDMGLVGSFNEQLAAFATETLQTPNRKKEIWTVGDRIRSPLEDSGLNVTKTYTVPASVTAITPLVTQVIIESEKRFNTGEFSEFFIFYNSPLSNSSYEQKTLRLLPLDNKWRKEMTELKWPGKQLPQVIGNAGATLSALISEYLFISLYKAAAESLAAENAARLESMERAEQNIDELLEALKHRYHVLRQNMIDEELFDVISGFEALQKKKKNIKN